MVVYISKSPEETERIGQRLSETLFGKVLITLDGDLGAGKTCLTRGLLAGWGGDVSHVSSPTYTLIHQYHSPRGTVFHIDAYRLDQGSDLEAIGMGEIFEQPAMVIIEWPQRIQRLLMSERIEILIEAIAPEERKVAIRR